MPDYNIASLSRQEKTNLCTIKFRKTAANINIARIAKPGYSARRIFYENRCEAP